MLVSGLLEKEETGCFPERQALQKPQLVWARSASCPRTAMGGPVSGTCHVLGTLPRSHLRRWPSPLTVSTRPRQGRPRAPAPGTQRAHLGAAQSVGSSLGVGHGAACPPSLRPCRGPQCLVPGFLEAAVLSLAGRLQAPAQGLSSSAAPTLPWPVQALPPLLPPRVTGTAPDGRAEGRGEWGWPFHRSELSGQQACGSRGGVAAVGRAGASVWGRAGWLAAVAAGQGTLGPLGTDHARAWCGGAGRAGGSGCVWVQPAWPLGGCQQHGREGLGLDLGVSVGEVVSPRWAVRGTMFTSRRP